MHETITSSLIIATYNWPAALEKCLQSVLRQSTPPTEILIADDGSGPETKAVIEKYQALSTVPIVHVWHPDEGFQLAKIRNRSMALAKGAYLIQIDGDLILDPHFVEDHLAIARPGFFTGGSRVLLDASLSNELLNGPTLYPALWDSRLKNKLNGMRFPGVRNLLAAIRKETKTHNLRGCNMAFWKSDIVAVNGYNEAIVGWGREDTELVVRLRNYGVQRNFFKFGGIAYHIFHRENDRKHLLENDEVLAATLAQKKTRCEKGIDQYL